MSVYARSFIHTYIMYEKPILSVVVYPGSWTKRKYAYSCIKKSICPESGEKYVLYKMAVRHADESGKEQKKVFWNY